MQPVPYMKQAMNFIHYRVPPGLLFARKNGNRYLVNNSPFMALLAATPILAFLKPEETIAFYKKLGFTCNAEWPGYLMFQRDQVSIHLWLCDDENIPKNTGCYVKVKDIEDLYQECTALGIIHPQGKLEDKPWNMRQFSILDNSGNIIHFGQELV